MINNEKLKIFEATKIELSNNMIAKFIGVDLHYSNDVYKDSKSSLRDRIDNRRKSEGLLFNSDWNWLMTVVEKINERDWVRIYSDECKIHSCLANEFETIIVVNEGLPMIKSVYDAVVKYVEWINSNDIKF